MKYEQFDELMNSYLLIFDFLISHDHYEMMNCG